MIPTVKLRDLTDALDLPAEWGAWLDRESGRVITLDPDTLAAAESEDDDEFLTEAPTADAEEQAAARAVTTGSPRYLALPDAFDFHEYKHMERFVAGFTNPRLAEPLWRAIKGKGAFRHFKDTAARLGVIEDWYRHRDNAMRDFMLGWAEANGIAVDDSTRPPKTDIPPAQ